jgi:hypothetical protein
VAGVAIVPVLILDVTEDEAKKILATFDPIGAMATADAVKLDAILREVETGNEALADMLTALADKASLYAIGEMADSDVESEDGSDGEDDEKVEVNLFSCPVSVDQEIVVRKAIAEAKRESGATTTGDALQVIAEAYLGTNS